MKIRRTINQMAKTPISEGASPELMDFLSPYGDMKKVCKKCGRYQKICICK